MKRKLFLILLLALAFGLGGYFLWSNGNDAVTMAASEKGSILTADTINVSFQGVGGKIIEVAVTEEQHVKKGDVLMRLDPTDIDQSIQSLESSIISTELQIQQAQEELAISKNIVESQVKQAQIGLENAYLSEQEVGAGITEQQRNQIKLSTENAKVTLEQAQLSEEQLKVSEYNIDLLEEQLNSLQIQMETLEIQKERMVLTAPQDGKVTQIVSKEGENVSAGYPVVLIETDQLYFDLYVDELQVSKFHVGDEVPVKVIALDKEYTGTVRTISSAPQYGNLRMSRDKGQSDLSAFQIRIDVERDSELISGMTVEVNVDEIAN